MYVQVCTRPNLAYIVDMLSKYLNKPITGKLSNESCGICKEPKTLALVYRKSDQREIIRYSDSDFADAKIVVDPLQAMYTC